MARSGHSPRRTKFSRDLLNSGHRRRAQGAIGTGPVERVCGADLVEHPIHQLANPTHRRAI
jgi:hypothetical protein